MYRYYNGLWKKAKERALLHKQKGKQRGVREEEKLDNRERIGHAESGHFI